MSRFKNLLVVSNATETYCLNPLNILYVESDGNYCNIYLADGEMLKSVSFQRQEIAKMIDKQLPQEVASKFVLLGRKHLINCSHLFYINYHDQEIHFDVKLDGNKEHVSIKVPLDPLRLLRKVLNGETVDNPAPRMVADTTRVPAGFTQHIASASRRRNTHLNYEVGDDEIMFLG